MSGKRSDSNVKFISNSKTKTVIYNAIGAPFLAGKGSIAKMNAEFDTCYEVCVVCHIPSSKKGQCVQVGDHGFISKTDVKNKRWKKY